LAIVLSVLFFFGYRVVCPFLIKEKRTDKTITKKKKGKTTR
jgi:hypothetical protein